MMNRKNSKLVAFLLIILMAITCTEDEMPIRPFPSVSTLAVSNITNSGAQFNAEILRSGNQEVIEYGFVWGQEKNPAIELNEKRVIADKITTGGFSAQIETTLKDGKKYYARAYAKSDDYLVYGINVAFLSLGSGAATIDDFYPKLGVWGDTINIKGRYFSYLKDHNQVLFKGIESEVISSTDSTIICIVPDDVSEKSVPISLKIAGQLTESKDNFEFILPEIESFSPMKGTFGEKIRIIGKDFSLINTENRISFNGHSAQVIESTETSLLVIVPISLNTQFSTIEITLKSISNPSKELFELIAPIIYEISLESGLPSAEMKIFGDNFNTDYWRNKAIFNSINAEVIGASKTELRVKVPAGTYTKRSFQVGVMAAGQTVYSSSMFTIEIPWLKKEDIPANENSLYRTTGFSLSNYGYVGLGSNSGFISNEFHKYDPLQNTWERITDFSGESRVDATSFVIDNYAYVGTGRTSYDDKDSFANDFWRFDPQSETWTEITNFPIPTMDAIGLSTNGIGYVCTQDISNNFWSYDPSKDEWIQMPDLNISSLGGNGWAKTGFVIEDRIYIVTDQGTNSSYESLFEFDTNTLQWSRKADAQYSRYPEVSFSIDNKGYIISRYAVSKYDPLTDSWKYYSKFPGESRREGVEFVIEDKAYYGSGIGKSDFWEYSPEYNR